MNIACLFGHKWDGCKCLRCGKKRDEQHDWNGCKCRRCEKGRDEQHDWDGCECRRCGKLRHAFNNENICTLCKAHLVTVVDEVVSYRDCYECPAANGYGCTVDTSTCVCSDDYRIVEYTEKTTIIFPNGDKKLYSQRTWISPNSTDTEE